MDPHAAQAVQFNRLERRVRFLTAHAAGSVVLISLLLLGGFRQAPQKQRFTEIDVERINIVEPDGRFAVVIANEKRLPGNIIDGLEYTARSGAGGIIFYNSEGDESGGLIHSSARSEDGTFKQAYGQLSLDRFEGDQVATLRYVEGSGYYEAGLQVSHQQRSGLVEWSRAQDSINRLPEGERAAAMRALRRRAFQQGNWEVPRVFAGETGRSAEVRLHDTAGRLRIRLAVDSLDNARLEFLDSEGKVARTISGLQP